MAQKNRPTLKSQYSNYINRVAPFDGNALVQKTEDDQVTQDLFDSLLNNTDSSDLINSPGAAISLDFSEFDMFRINSSGSGAAVFTITVNNLGTGQVARIHITKKSNDTFSFSNATIGQISNLKQAGKTILVFWVHNVNGVLTAYSDLIIAKSDALDEDNTDQLATSKAAFDLDAKKADKTQPAWVAIDDVVTTGFTTISSAFVKTNDQGISSFKGSILVAQTSGSAPAVAIGEINVGNRPDRDIRAAVAIDKSGTGTSIIVEPQGIQIFSSTGEISINSPGTPNSWTIFLDELSYFQNG